MKAIIRVEQQRTHPHFEGNVTVSFDFFMNESEAAAAKYNEFADDDLSGYSSTTMHIVWVTTDY